VGGGGVGLGLLVSVGAVVDVEFGVIMGVDVGFGAGNIVTDGARSCS